MENKKRDIKYLNRDFSSFKNSLINFSKTYFPKTYNNFTPSSTGMLFIEMASFVGDVLSFYQDINFQETFIQFAQQENNIFNLAYNRNYRPKVTSPSIVDVDFYQELPAITSGSITVPDYNYSIKIPENTELTSINGIKFLLQDKVDFSISSSLDPTEVSVSQISGNTPTFYLLRKTKKAISATIQTQTISVTTPEKFLNIEVTSPNIIGILDIRDSDGNLWYEVEHLAQDSIFESIPNNSFNDPNFSNDSTDVPNLLKIKQVQRRFTTRFLNRETLQLEFGSGTTNVNDEELIPNPENVGIGLPSEKSKLTTAFSPLNFVLTNTYGIAPSNTILTIRYLTGGGVQSNIEANSLNQINTSNIVFNNPNISNSSLAQSIFNSIAVNNQFAADGGGSGDTLEEIKQNALGSFQGQLRVVTFDDYLIRTLSMPSSFGAIAKAYVEPTKINNINILGEKTPMLDLYVLSYDFNKKLRVSSQALKQNIKTYLSQYTDPNDKIRIKDAYIINIGIEYDVIALPNYNNNEVLLRCNDSLTEEFRIERWNINQPILLSRLYILLDNIEGVQTVKSIKITNKTGISLGYSNFAYDVGGALIDGVIYPSIDPMIFELKYPNIDIKGRIVSF